MSNVAYVKFSLHGEYFGDLGDGTGFELTPRLNAVHKIVFKVRVPDTYVCKSTSRQTHDVKVTSFGRHNQNLDAITTSK